MNKFIDCINIATSTIDINAFIVKYSQYLAHNNAGANFFQVQQMIQFLPRHLEEWTTGMMKDFRFEANKESGCLLVLRLSKFAIVEIGRASCRERV